VSLLDSKLDKEIDEVIENKIKPEITQADSIDPSVEKHLGEMGFYFDTIHRKVSEDKVCFKCKKALDIPKEEAFILEAANVDKGVIVFVCLCKECYEEGKNKQNKV
jgi:hypothetical protein